MDRIAADNVTKALLANMRRQLQQAVIIAKAAEVCAEGANIQGAVKMAMDIEEMTHRVDRMLGAALLIGTDLMDD